MKKRNMQQGQEQKYNITIQWNQWMMQSHTLHIDK